MSLYLPDGYFFEGHICFGDPGRGCVLAKGYAVDFPDLSASDDDAFIGLESDIRLMLGSLKTDERLQLTFYTSSDFSAPLDRYEVQTQKSKVAVCREVRSELVQRFRDRMRAQTLIQSNARLYLSSKLPKFIKESGRTIRAFDDVFKVLKRSFEQGSNSLISCSNPTAAVSSLLATWTTTGSCLGSGHQARRRYGLLPKTILTGSVRSRAFAASATLLPARLQNAASF